MLDIASSITKIVNELVDISDEENKKYIGDLIGLIEHDNINHIMEKISEAVVSICRCVQAKMAGKSNASQWREDIIAFIENNYSNPDLSVSMISEHLGLHPVYISKIFKEQGGIGLLEYINKYRINKAKELIRKGNLKLLEVAEAIGYTNTRTFNRTFKKFEGITPSEYAQLTKANV